MSVPERAEGALLDRARARTPVPLDDLVGLGGVLVIAPHPDDETLGCGMAIRAALAAGRDVGVLLLTGGGNSHPSSRSHPPQAMKALRRDEFERALAALSDGLTPPTDTAGREPGRLVRRTLDLPDGSVPHDAGGLRDALDAAQDLARDVAADALWCAWGGDPHIDHLAASRLADLLETSWRGMPPLRRDYAVWGRFRLAGRDVPPARVLPFDAPQHRAAKRTAMAAYASQLTPLIEDDPTGFVMPPALVEHFAESSEIFLVPKLAERRATPATAPSTLSRPTAPDPAPRHRVEAKA